MQASSMARSLKQKKQPASQQTQNICMTFVQRWTNVEDVGPTFYKCYTNVLCLLGDHQVIPANLRRWTSAGLMLGHRRRRGFNFKPALIQCFLSQLIQRATSNYRPFCIMPEWCWLTATDNHRQIMHILIRMVSTLASLIDGTMLWIW